MKILFLYFLIPFLISYFLIKVIKPYLNKFFIESPNLRSSHLKPKPSGGGIVFVLIGIIGSVFLGWYMPLLFIPLAIIGLLDDFIKIKPIWRYIIQLNTAFLIVLKSNFFYFLKDFNLTSEALIFIFLAIFSTAIINFINFMDGIDGLVSGCMIIILTIICISSQIALLPLISSILVFLIFNWYPSSFFMGDVGHRNRTHYFI